MKLVQVTWVDAIGDDGWLSLEELRKEKPTAHNSVGYLAHETEDFITITMSYDDVNDNMGGWLCIPKPYIQTIKEL